MKEVKVECSNCQGEGYADGDSGYSCSVCDGTGWEYEVESEV